MQLIIIIINVVLILLTRDEQSGCHLTNLLADTARDGGPSNGCSQKVEQGFRRFHVAPNPDFKQRLLSLKQTAISGIPDGLPVFFVRDQQH